MNVPCTFRIFMYLPMVQVDLKAEQYPSIVSNRKCDMKQDNDYDPGAHSFDPPVNQYSTPLTSSVEVSWVSKEYESFIPV